MLSNALRRVTSCCVANIHKLSHHTDKTVALTRLPILKQSISARCMSRTDQPNDELDELLDQMFLDPEDFVPTSDSFGDEGNLAELEDSGPSLPGHRIRDILVPTAETLNALVEGQAYDRLPIAHVHTSWQNTIILISDYKGSTHLATSSGGTVGFRNAKKRTAVAAHTAALAAGKEALIKGVTHVRVALRGRGQGRLSSCKGFEEAGLKIVSISDVSELNWGTHFAKKRRRL